MATTVVQETAVSAPVQVEKDFSQYSFDKLEPYQHPPETKEDLPWSELVTLDLEDYHRKGGKERLAKLLGHAVHHVGFVCHCRIASCIRPNHTLTNGDTVLRQELWFDTGAG